MNKIAPLRLRLVILAFVDLGSLFLSQSRPVQGLWTTAHTITVLLRV